MGKYNISHSQCRQLAMFFLKEYSTCVFICLIIDKKHFMQNPKDNIYAYTGIDIPISSANINKTGYMLAERVKYTSLTGRAIISTANSNLDGTGTTVDIITGSSNGTLIKRITIKAQGSTTQGMVRIFFKAVGTFYLWREIEVPAITQDATHQTLIAEINEPFYLKASYLFSASTEKGETFIVTAEGQTMTWPA